MSNASPPLSRDAHRELFKQRLREAMFTVWRLAVEHDDAPEGIEICYAWHQLPYRREMRATVQVEPEQGFAVFGPTESRATVDALCVEARITGSVELDAPQGKVDMPWWVGWDEVEKVAVVSCGP
jgi:hypothetical protein